jgi:acyl-CoA thioesterase YciA
MSDDNLQPKGGLQVRTAAMPADTNPNGDIFGGWVLSQMDIAGGMAAYLVAHGRVATVAVDAMKFHRPVKVGDILCVYTEVDGIGNTSITVRLQAWAQRAHQARRIRELVTEGTFTFVAIDGDGCPRQVPRA